ncbi:MAG: response regulator [Candidatus Acidiferrales bacterium]
MKSKILVYLVTSNRLLREALARLLSKKDDFEVCGVSSDLPEVPSSFVTLGPDVLVLDAITAQPSDYALIPDIAAQLPRLKIVLIDMDDDPETFLRCVRAGAMGYLLKDASAMDVISGVRCVAQGQAVCPSQMCTPLFRTVARQWTSFPSARVKVEDSEEPHSSNAEARWRQRSPAGNRLNAQPWNVPLKLPTQAKERAKSLKTVIPRRVACP